MAAARKPTRRKKSKAEEISGTKLELTLAAEKVFAIHGVQGASLRQIREEAGQKNESAIHYYFGSREAIIESVLSLRANPLDHARQTMFDEMKRGNGGRPLSTEQTVRCAIMPLACYLLDDGNRSFYLRFLVQLRMERKLWLYFNNMYGKGMEKCLAALRESRPYIPRAIIEQRFLNMQYIHTNGLAALERILWEKGEDFRYEEGWIRVEDMITSTAAMYDAPLSPATLAAIREAGARHGLPAYIEVSIYGDTAYGGTEGVDPGAT
ncbi:TetR family transcriptional regulator [Alloalcanivorax dieselolei B5]|uniref:TetR family transcriptional regulator n=1 Tax=Alcanivorax dieselolei (strain DSM 16502 / CGMCC 1.3690 / MCCC 1A00001 / B-5) TaxID=930169 RepID=K0CEU6_ALCDB|nr:TetR family transcriptional regulator [Alloalcanivorax dieselolei]AFT71163.1 TetR family transcriptional regulator [Alloalcanivorax dieselolei B5]GGJ93597.1 hypothetical protein GCM10007426_23190 [Alloalcanivorax dieselolei]